MVVGSTVVAVMIEETMKFRDGCEVRHNRNTSSM